MKEIITTVKVKKSGHPTQPGNRSTDPKQTQRNRKYKDIIYQIAQIFKRLKWGRIAVLCLALLGAFHLIGSTYAAIFVKDKTHTEPSDLALKAVPEYIVRDDEGSPVNVWATEAGYVKRYDLTNTERWEVASVVTAEAGGEPFEGMVAVAQCILQQCEDDGIRPGAAVITYKYTESRPEPTKEALEAVQAVFDLGQVATNQPIKYFYAPALVYSEWHETQDYVMTINGHRFFKEAE